MKKIRTITFHSAYNFGSMLQAYALQEYIKKLYNGNVDYKIINLRTKIQKDVYNYRISSNLLNKLLKTILYGKKLKKREQNFEKFISENLNVTREYLNEEELKKDNIKADYFISGSDQVWNLNATDFSWSYFLDFSNNGKKISYATSMGPIEKERKEEEKIKKYLSEYDNISVREKQSQEYIYSLIGKESEVNVDPTLLLNKEDYESLIDEKRIRRGKYILYYTLKPNKNRQLLLKKIGKSLNMPIVVANMSLKYDINSGFRKLYNSGPKEFLNLIKNAELVITSSFHGTVFSILFNKNFYSLNGKNDFRIHGLLKELELENREILETDNINEIIKNAFNTNYENVDEKLNKERNKAKKYLEKSLEI